MQIHFLNHALRRMSERNLSQALVKKVIERPDKVEHSIKDSQRFLFKKKYLHNSSQERLLIVITEKNDNVLIVVTVIDTSKVQKHW